jgi:outer membrane lipoprotein-sorting protein
MEMDLPNPENLELFMRRITAKIVIICFCALLGTPAAAIADGKTVEDIKKCIKANAPKVSSSQTVLMRTVDRAGETSETRALIIWKRPEGEKGRVLLRVVDPPTRRGAALLMIERGEMDADFHLYLPELRKTRRVAKKSLQGSMFGTDLSYEDFQHVQQMTEDSTLQRGEDSELGGKKVYTLRAQPKEDSAYEKVISFVDQERCLVLRSEYYESGDKPRKTLSVNEDKITKEPFGWLPREIRVEDLEDGTHTDLIVEKFDSEADISDSDLSVAQLEKAGR